MEAKRRRTWVLGPGLNVNCGCIGICIFLYILLKINAWSLILRRDTRNKACASYAIEMFNLYARRNEVTITHHPPAFPSSSHLI